MSEFDEARAILSKVASNIGTVMQGQSASIRMILSALASGGHVLLEDVPGTGKTTLAKALALSFKAEFKRLQFTPDLLPSDILGVSIYNQQQRQFEFHPGPVFSNILLADEINRASPRTQSALLEAMAEGQVSIEGQLKKLPDLFFVVATQNPVEFRGTYPLPEAQMDRFALKFKLGYVGVDQETAVMRGQQSRHPIETLAPCSSLEEMERVQAAAGKVRISDELVHYIVRLVGGTRAHKGVQLGASPRASIALMKTAQAMALYDGDAFVTPDHVQALAVPVIAHRLAIDPQARFAGESGEAIVADIVKRTEVPS